MAKLPTAFQRDASWGWEVGCRDLLLNKANIECQFLEVQRES